jgi:hypothetical protein
MRVGHLFGYITKQSLKDALKQMKRQSIIIILVPKKLGGLQFMVKD